MRDSPEQWPHSTSQVFQRSLIGVPLSGVASSARQDTIPVSPGISHNMNAGISLKTRRLQTQQTGVFRHTRQIEVWLCRFLFFFVSRSQPPVKVCHRSFFFYYLYCCCDLCLRSRGCPFASYDSSYTAARAASACWLCSFGIFNCDSFVSFRAMVEIWGI